MAQTNQIGPYEIIREIGRGGMGVVYLAKHPTLGIDVALKAMFPDPSRDKDDPVFLMAQERFKKEADITAKLNDPHIITIYDVGSDTHNEMRILYIAMKYLEGGSLKDAIKRKGCFTLKETLEIIQPIAKSLEYVHKQGIIHRDLKPGNIMFLRDSPVITDFGIAKDVKDTIKTITDETGRLVGTIPYMSPEIINEQEFDHRADIYSLGLVIFEMLTGNQPFKSDTAEGTINKVMNVHPSLKSYISLNLPADFTLQVDQMIIKSPYNRADSLNPLITYRKHHPIRLKDIQKAYIPTLSQKLIWLVSLILVIALFVIIGSVRQYLRIYDSRSLSNLAGVKVQNELYDDAIELCNQALDKYSRNTDAYAFRADAESKKNKSEEWGYGDPPRNIKSDCDEALRWNPANEIALIVRGEYHLLRKDHKDAITDFTRAILIKGSSRAYVGRAQAYMAEGEYKSAYRDYAKAIELIGGNWEDDPYIEIARSGIKSAGQALGYEYPEGED